MESKTYVEGACHLLLIFCQVLRTLDTLFSLMSGHIRGSSAKRNLCDARIDIKGASKLVVVVLHVDMYVQIFQGEASPGKHWHAYTNAMGNSRERTADREHFVVGGKPWCTV